MLDIASYAKAEGIPYKYWLADSWWYFKDPDGPNGGGVTNWTARPDVFPHGLEYVYQQTGWAVQGHNRFWSNKTTYAKEYGGDYAFLLDVGGYALPAEQRFWDDLLLSSRVKWGLAVYEQDWLDQEVSLLRRLEQQGRELRPALLSPPRSSRYSSTTSRRSPRTPPSRARGSRRWQPAPRAPASPCSTACRTAATSSPRPSSRR